LAAALSVDILFVVLLDKKPAIAFIYAAEKIAHNYNPRNKWESKESDNFQDRFHLS
jgi:hypothetical protein